MKTENVRGRTQLSRRVVAGLFALSLLIGACGNTGPTQNIENGAGNGQGPVPSETVPPDVPRNVK